MCPFCGLDNIPDLTEFWSHVDMAGQCPGKAVGVKIRLDNGILGFIQLRNLSDKPVVNPEERVRVKSTIHCRIIKIVVCSCSYHFFTISQAFYRYLKKNSSTNVSKVPSEFV